MGKQIFVGQVEFDYLLVHGLVIRSDNSTTLSSGVSEFLLTFTEGGGGEAVDPYDLIDPVNILPMLPKDFYDKVVSVAYDSFCDW